MVKKLQSGKKKDSGRIRELEVGLDGCDDWSYLESFASFRSIMVG